MKKEKGLIQSNLTTFGVYKFTSWQMNCLVHLVEQLQPAMSRDIDWLSADLKVFQETLPPGQERQSSHSYTNERD